MQAENTAGTGGLIWQDKHTWTGSGEGRFNEDYALISPEAHCAVLVDGATGLTKANVVAGESDASWYARSLCGRLVERLSDARVGTIEALAAAGAAVASDYREFPGADTLKRIDEPNGSLAVLRWQGDVVEVTMLGDCVVVVGMRDGTEQLVYDDTLSRLDEKNYERMYAFACERGTTMAEARRALNPRFIENRLKMNEPGGYWAADISCRGMTHAFTCTFARKDVCWLFASSDGFANAREMGVVESFEELGRRTAAGEGVAIGESLRAAELADAGCWRVHRSKTSDDATYVALRFGVEDA